MDENASTAGALLAALGLVRTHGGAQKALEAAGIGLPDTERFEGLSDDYGDLFGPSATDKGVSEALALGYLAGRVAHRPRMRTDHDPTAFVMDQDLVVQAAEGESVLRLPWFDDELFVGRQLPDINEMPTPVRTLCVGHYTSALAGERTRFAFSSYGHAYSVDSVPVHGSDGHIQSVLAIATPGRSVATATRAYRRTAERFDSSADRAEERAAGHRLAGRDAAEAEERKRAQRARRAADRARAHLWERRSGDSSGMRVVPPSITERQAEVLTLASHGLTVSEIADELCVTVATAKTHLENLYSKLGVSDKAAAVAVGLRHGLIE
jgi:DNA-binding NarL/FixJ family response regulator